MAMCRHVQSKVGTGSVMKQLINNEAEQFLAYFSFFVFFAGLASACSVANSVFF